MIYLLFDKYIINYTKYISFICFTFFHIYSVQFILFTLTYVHVGNLLSLVWFSAKTT